MSEKAGFLGLGTAGGVAAGVGVLAVALGVLYATGVLVPDRGEPVAAVPEATAPSEDAPVIEAPAEPSVAAPSEDEPVTEAPAEDTSPEPAPEVTETEEPDASQPSDVAPLMPPQFDVVRASPDGTTIVAGQGAPGSTISILIDGVIADTQIVDDSGEFVSILSLSSSTAARVLSLSASLDDREAISDDEIILAPTPAPQVAAVEPEPEASASASEPAEDPVQTPDPEQSVASGTAEAEDAPSQPEPAETAALTDDAAQTDSAALSDAPEPVVPAAPTAPTTAATPSPPDEPAAIAVLRADREGVELVQPPTPEAPLPVEQIALDTIGYSSEGDVLLSGRAAPKTDIRVYLDNVPRADLLSQEDGRWRAQLSGIDPGVYTLRLDALEADGTVLSRIETPFKREDPEVLTAAQEDPEPEVAVQPIRQVTVQTGDTLWAISRDRYGDGLLYVRVFEANRDSIRDPDLIYPGQIFAIPE